MTAYQLREKIKQLKEYQRMAEEATDIADTLKEEIKQEMTERGTSELQAGEYVVRWTAYTASKFDSKAFKAENGDLYNRYLRQAETRRFSIV
mgnify:CR=1 FL=1